MTWAAQLLSASSKLCQFPYEVWKKYSKYKNYKLYITRNTGQIYNWWKQLIQFYCIWYGYMFNLFVYIYSCICACVKQVTKWIKREWRYRMSVGRKINSSIFFEMHLSKGYLYKIKENLFKIKKKKKKLSQYIYTFSYKKNVTSYL